MEILQLVDNIKLQSEDRPLEGDHICRRSPLVHTEEFKVSAEIKDIELVFVFPVNKAGAEPGPAADHLPELGLAHDLFKEYEVQHFRHVDAGIQHIYGNSNLRQFFSIGEFVDGTLRILRVIVNNLGISIQMRILFIKYLKDFFCMLVVLGKDDRLPDLVSVINLQAVLHKDTQHLADGICVEKPLVQCT